MTRDPGTDATLASDGAASRAGDAGAASPLPEIARATYVVKGELARGGMGKILVAEDTRLGRDVALKELLVGDAPADHPLALRFAREVRTTARLQHPGIVAIYEAGRWPDGSPFYAMRLVKGRSLEKVVEEKAKFVDRLGLVANLVKLCEAMAYAHDRGVIHRDLKPANVLVGDYGETVVIDWGLAKDLTLADDEPTEVTTAAPVDAGSAATLSGDAVAATMPSDEPAPRSGASSDGGLTVVGAVLGTPAYMPPEQAKGERVDKRADVYSLGALIYHVLAGAAPYRGRTVAEVLAAVRDGKPRAAFAPEVPAELVTIVDRAMAADPEARYPSARELADELGRFAAGQLIASHRYTVRQLVRRWIGRHKGLFVASQVAAVAAIALAVFVIRGVVRDRERARAQHLAALEESGRDALAEHRPMRAAPYLVAAYREGADDEALRTMLGDAMRAVDASTAAIELDEPVRELAWVGDRLLARTEDRFYLIDPATGAHDALAPPRRWEPQAAVVSPDHQTLASTDGSTIRVFDIATHATRELAIDGVREGALAVANDGRVAVAGDTKLTVFTGDRPATFDYPVHQVAFAADGTLYAANDTKLVAYDRALAVVRQTEMASAIGGLYVCGAARYVTRVRAAATSDDGGPLRGGMLLDLLDADDKPTELGEIQPTAFTCAPHPLVIQDDGEAPIAQIVGGDDPSIMPLGLVHEHAGFANDETFGTTDDITYASAGAGAHLVAGGTTTGELRVWDRATGVVVAQLDAHPGRIAALAFDAGDRLATGGDDGYVRVWAFAVPPTAPAISALEPQVAVRSRDGKVNAVAAIGEVVVTTPAGTRRLTGLDELATWLGLSDDGAQLAALARDGHLRMWSTATGASLASWDAGTVTIAAMAPDGTLAAGDAEGDVRLYRAGQAQAIVHLGGHAGPVHSIVWSRDGAALLTAADTTIRLWTRDGKLAHQLGNGEPVARAWWMDGGKLVAAETARSVVVFDAARDLAVMTQPLGLAPMALGNTAPRVLPDGDAPRGLVVTASAAARVAIPRETRDAEALAALVGARSPWRLDDGALAPRVRQVAPHSTLVDLATTQRARAYDLTAEIIEAAPTTPMKPLVAGTSYARAWELRRAGDLAGAFAAIAQAGAGLDEVGDFAALAHAPVADAIAAIGGDGPERRLVLAHWYAHVGAYDRATEALAVPARANDPETLARELQLADIADALGRPTEIVDHLERAVDAAPPAELAALHAGLAANCSDDYGPVPPGAATPARAVAMASRQQENLFAAFVASRDFRYAIATNRALALVGRLGANRANVDDCTKRLEEVARETLVRGMLTKKVVRAPLHATEPAMIACYTLALDRDPALAGTVTVQFVTGPLGVPEHVTAKADAKLDALAACVKATIERVQYPHTSAGDRLNVTAPFVFHPIKG